jgi:Thoeris protein ThsB, TIR-like domain
MSTNKHKVFISFHHGNKTIDPKCGQYWKERFESLFRDYYETIISRSVQDGDIKDGIQTETTRQKIRDEFIADATVTVVLIGPDTWKRKHVDWEISSSIRDTKNNSRCGLIGILLPTYPNYDSVKNTYNGNTIPPRLQKNIDCGFATIHVWNENSAIVSDWIHKAFERRNKINPDNSYPMFANNRPDNQTKWQ